MPRPHAKLVFLDWSKVQLIAALQPPICAHQWVSDESIRQAIDERNFDDPGIPWTEKTHRAARIATIALMMQAGVSFRPLHLYAGRKSVNIRDGNHRLRAFQFTQHLSRIPSYLYGDTSVFKPCLAEGEVWSSRERSTPAATSYQTINTPMWQFIAPSIQSLNPPC